MSLSSVEEKDSSAALKIKPCFGEYTPLAQDFAAFVILKEYLLISLPSLPLPLLKRTHVVSAKGATGERLLIAFTMDHIYLDTGNGHRRELCAAIAPVPLGASEYAAILPAELLSFAG